MFTRPFHPENFLQRVYGTKPFLDYCRLRGIPFEHSAGSMLHGDDMRRWRAALAQLPGDNQARIYLELAKVTELSGDSSTACLLEAVDDASPPHDIPGNEALSLWFFLHHPDVFHEVFLHEEIQELGSWRIARATPGITLDDLGASAAALKAAVGEFFAVRQRTGHFCAVDAYRLRDAYCFAAHVSDRLRFLDAFTDQGERTLQRLRPTLRVLLAYRPDDGTILLRSHLRARHRILALFQCFGRAVLGEELSADCLQPLFDLDRLKGEFQPLPDAGDMELVRLKALHLRYPERAGRRQVKLETLTSDEPAAVRHLLQMHFPGGQTLEQLRVAHAEVQVRLRLDRGSKNYLIRLWPDRCNLNQTPLGDRLRACLRRWGLTHVR